MKISLKDAVEAAIKSSKKQDILLAAEGKKRVKCKQCNGTGIAEPGFTDHDGSGSFWVSSVDCRYCSYGRVKVACSKEEKIDALRKFLAKAKRKLEKELNS